MGDTVRQGGVGYPEVPEEKGEKGNREYPGYPSKSANDGPTRLPGDTKVLMNKL